VGVEVGRSAAPPPLCSLKILPAGDYALVTTRGAEITADWTGELARGFLAPAGRELAGDFSLNVYDRRFKGMDRLGESELDVLLPLKAAGRA
ncbi:MAG: GyrI-like domain-containing protein, partial [Spirochaetaceae bacterium]|nr:GyrI-like domain-containing protein [Spirochaetaceae bacterium]